MAPFACYTRVDIPRDLVNFNKKELQKLYLQIISNHSHEASKTACESLLNNCSIKNTKYLINQGYYGLSNPYLKVYHKTNIVQMFVVMAKVREYNAYLVYKSDVLRLLYKYAMVLKTGKTYCFKKDVPQLDVVRFSEYVVHVIEDLSSQNSYGTLIVDGVPMGVKRLCEGANKLKAKLVKKGVKFTLGSWNMPYHRNDSLNTMGGSNDMVVVKSLSTKMRELQSKIMAVEDQMDDFGVLDAEEAVDEATLAEMVSSLSLYEFKVQNLIQESVDSEEMKNYDDLMGLLENVKQMMNSLKARMVVSLNPAYIETHLSEVPELESLLSGSPTEAHNETEAEQPSSQIRSDLSTELEEERTSDPSEEIGEDRELEPIEVEREIAPPTTIAPECQPQTSMESPRSPESDVVDTDKLLYSYMDSSDNTHRNYDSMLSTVDEMVPMQEEGVMSQKQHHVESTPMLFKREDGSFGGNNSSIEVEEEAQIEYPKYHEGYELPESGEEGDRDLLPSPVMESPEMTPTYGEDAESSSLMYESHPEGETPVERKKLLKLDEDEEEAELEKLLEFGDEDMEMEMVEQVAEMPEEEIDEDEEEDVFVDKKDEELFDHRVRSHEFKVDQSHQAPPLPEEEEEANLEEKDVKEEEEELYKDISSVMETLKRINSYLESKPPKFVAESKNYQTVTSSTSTLVDQATCTPPVEATKTEIPENVDKVEVPEKFEKQEKPEIKRPVFKECQLLKKEDNFTSDIDKNLYLRLKNAQYGRERSERTMLASSIQPYDSTLLNSVTSRTAYVTSHYGNELTPHYGNELTPFGGAISTYSPYPAPRQHGLYNVSYTQYSVGNLDEKGICNSKNDIINKLVYNKGIPSDDYEQVLRERHERERGDEQRFVVGERHYLKGGAGFGDEFVYSDTSSDSLSDSENELTDYSSSSELTEGEEEFLRQDTNEHGYPLLDTTNVLDSMSDHPKRQQGAGADAEAAAASASSHNTPSSSNSNSNSADSEAKGSGDEAPLSHSPQHSPREGDQDLNYHKLYYNKYKQEEGAEESGEQEKTESANTTPNSEREEVAVSDQTPVKMPKKHKSKEEKKVKKHRKKRHSSTSSSRSTSPKRHSHRVPYVSSRSYEEREGEEKHRRKSRSKSKSKHKETTRKDRKERKERRRDIEVESVESSDYRGHRDERYEREQGRMAERFRRERERLEREGRSHKYGKYMRINENDVRYMDYRIQEAFSSASPPQGSGMMSSYERSDMGSFDSSFDRAAYMRAREHPQYRDVYWHPDHMSVPVPEPHQPTADMHPHLNPDSQPQPNHTQPETNQQPPQPNPQPPQPNPQSQQPQQTTQTPGHTTPQKAEKTTDQPRRDSNDSTQKEHTSVDNTNTETESRATTNIRSEGEMSNSHTVKNIIKYGGDVVFEDKFIVVRYQSYKRYEPYLYLENTLSIQNKSVYTFSVSVDYSNFDNFPLNLKFLNKQFRGLELNPDAKITNYFSASCYGPFIGLPRVEITAHMDVRTNKVYHVYLPLAISCFFLPTLDLNNISQKYFVSDKFKHIMKNKVYFNAERGMSLTRVLEVVTEFGKFKVLQHHDNNYYLASTFSAPFYFDCKELYKFTIFAMIEASSTHYKVHVSSDSYRLANSVSMLFKYILQN